MRSIFTLAACVVATTIASASATGRIRERAPAPTVTIKNGTVIGTTSNNVDSFSGIPYALPPVGNYRLRPARSIDHPFPTFTAPALAPACPQFLGTIDVQANLIGSVLPLILNSPLLQAATTQSEDCLTVTIQRPANTASDAKLPVIFWIYGGAFELGWSSMYDGQNFVRRSVFLGQPVIYVAVNYRVGGLGFLAGRDLAAEGSTNLGLRDQRKALEWVQENIGAFGGDPDKVTIWGESAGSVSVCDHLIINGGDHTYNGRPLFRAAIMNSGTIAPALDVDTPKAQNIYETVLKNANCQLATDRLACLRALSTERFMDAANSVPWLFSYRTIDLSYLPRPDPRDGFFAVSPDVPFTTGAYARVPIIVGDQEDEGTLFALTQSNLSTNADVVGYLAPIFAASSPNATALAEGLMATYPDDPRGGQPAGSPFDTGSNNNLYPQYKRLAAVSGDLVFNLPRRIFLRALSVGSGVTTWSYLATYLHGTSFLGTPHGSDLAFNMASDNSSIVNTIQGYYISFITQLDPNALQAQTGLIEWPRWELDDPVLLEIGKSENGYLSDTYRNATYQYMLEHGPEFRT